VKFGEKSGWSKNRSTLERLLSGVFAFHQHLNSAIRIQISLACPIDWQVARRANMPVFLRGQRSHGHPAPTAIAVKSDCRSILEQAGQFQNCLQIEQ
jgi:hypothetical protein